MTAALVVGGLVYYPRHLRGKRRGIWEILEVYGLSTYGSVG